MIAALENNFLLLFMRQSGGHGVLAPSVTAVMPNLSMVLSKDRVQALALAHCCHAKLIHGACKRHTVQVSLHSLFCK